MRRYCLYCLVLLLLPVKGRSETVQEAPANDERIPLEQLLTRSEMTAYQSRPRYPDRLRVLRSALERRTDRLKSEINDRNLAVIFRTLAEFRGLLASAMEISQAEVSEKELRHREVKRMEITLRRATDQLSQQKLDVPLEDRNQFEMTVEMADFLRNRLLRQLFGAALGQGDMPPGGSGFLSTAPPSGSAQGHGLWDRDRFTELEYSRIQLAQQLVKRVDAFLEIAESRLVELERRRDGAEWEGKEDNPLEFYTLDDLAFAYSRAVDGIMVNIDAQVEARQVSERDVRRALRKLDGKIGEFIDRLGGLEAYVRDRRDPEFAKEWEEAARTSEIARKGAAYGLGKVGTED